MVGQMSMIIHVRWVGGVVNVHMDKIFKKGYVGGNTTLEKMLNKTLLLFPSKNIDQTKLSFLATRLNTSGNV